jgi:hypothetical protein
MVDAPGETIRDLNKYIFISKMLRCRNTKKEESAECIMSKTNSRLFHCFRVRFLRYITGKVVYRVSENS